MTRESIHPGETIREDIEALGMSAAELGRLPSLADDNRLSASG